MRPIIAVLGSAIAITLIVAAFLPAPDSGRYRYTFDVTIQTPGGELPFHIVMQRNSSAFPKDARIYPGPIGVPRPLEESAIHVLLPDFDPEDLSEIVIPFEHYDSELKLTQTEGHRYKGAWRKVRGSGVAELPVKATRVIGSDNLSGVDPDAGRSHQVVANSERFSGRWRVQFESSDDTAIGDFSAWGNLVIGTFLTTTGDYRHLRGVIDGDLMRLSTFDGAHAFLFHARLQPDGTIAGDFWSGDWWHETWTATRDDDAQLPDMFAQTSAPNEDALDELVFTNLEGEPTRVVDALNATNAPVRIIEVFGSWCPNCADAGRELAELKKTYGDKLGILGLAFELTDDHERSSTQVKRYLERFGADWDVLIAGLNNKDAATEELAILDQVRAYPTTIFLNSDNEIVEIHTGFTGPATGDAYTEQHERYVSIIESLIHGE